MLDILLGSIFGTFLGIVTGLVPGLHVNTVALLFITLLPAKTYSNFLLATFISMAIAHTILDFIPSIFFGAPEDSTALSVLPGHKLLVKGEGYKAFYLTVLGGIFSFLLTLFSLPLLTFLLKPLYQFLKNFIPYILLLITGFLILSEKKISKILYSILCFLLAGILGIIVLERNFVGQEVLFPVFTGLFGIPNLIYSLKNRKKIRKQKISRVKLKFRKILKNSIKSFISSIFVGILPGLGSAQAATISTQFSKSDEDFLMVIGGINTVVAFVSILSLILIGNPRSGIAVYIEKIIAPNPPLILLLIGSSLLSISLSSLLGMQIAKFFAKSINKFDYRKASICIIVFVSMLVVSLTGINGFIVYLASISIGMLAPIFKIRRSNYMGVLILPLLLFYFQNYYF